MSAQNGNDHPRLREPLAFVALDDRTVRIYEFGSPSIELHGPAAALCTLLNMCDGEHNRAEILAALAPEIPGARLSGFIESLISRDILVHARPERRSSEPERYDRQLRFLSRFGGTDAALAMHHRIRQAKVALLGSGGAGAYIAQSLASAGVGMLRIVDPDRAEVTNLNRHPLLTAEDTGRLKIDVCTERLRAMNPDTRFEGVPEWVSDPSRTMDLIEGCDLVVCSADSPPVRLRRIVNAAALATGIPVLFFGAWRVGPLVEPGRTPCWECFEDDARRHDAHWDLMVDNFRIPPAPPSIVSVPAISGTLAGFEVLKYVSGLLPVATLGTVVAVDPATLATSTYDIEGECEHARVPATS